MEENNQKGTFVPLSEEEQKDLMSENAQLRLYNAKLGKALEEYQTGIVIKRVDWLFKICENAGFAFTEEAVRMAADKIVKFVLPEESENSDLDKKENE